MQKWDLECSNMKPPVSYACVKLVEKHLLFRRSLSLMGQFLRRTPVRSLISGFLASNSTDEPGSTVRLWIANFEACPQVNSVVSVNYSESGNSVVVLDEFDPMRD